MVEVPENDIRFQTELEFIQCLASPSYLHCMYYRYIRTVNTNVECSFSYQSIFGESCVFKLFGVFIVLEAAEIRQIHCVRTVDDVKTLISSYS